MMLKDRVALITGGAQGMGFAAAKRFLEKDFAGVLLVDRNGAKLDEARQRLAGLGAVETITGDLNDLALGATAVARVKERFGRLDALLNAAGSTERCGLDDTTPEAYERIFNLNVRAPLFMMQEAVKLMRPARRGTIVNVASMLSYIADETVPAYTASKTGIIGLTRALAHKYGRDGVRVNAIVPGYHRTDMTEALWSVPESEIGISERSALKRWRKTRDLVGPVLFLCSPAATFVTGVTLPVDGGYHVG